jgi:3-dehydroquinate dehydratase-1
MRLQSETKVIVKDKVIGGALPLVCLPLVAKDRVELLEQAEASKPNAPDLLEWRIDAYGAVKKPDACLGALEALHASLASTPLILTCRIHAEGGFRELTHDVRQELFTACIGSGRLDLVDIEMCSPPSFVEGVKSDARKNRTGLILSYHNFTETPDEAFIHDKILQAQEMGGDIAKVAVMPKDYKDVLTLLGATLKARTGAVKIPIVTMSMGAEGVLTRIAGGLYGSDITFAAGRCASAPGQIPIGELRRAMSVLYR